MIETTLRGQRLVWVMDGRSKDDKPLRVVWNGDSETDCVEVCGDLQREGIEYRVSQQLVSRSSRMGVTWKFEVSVLACDYDRARATLGFGEGREAEEAEQAFEIGESSGLDTRAEPEEIEKRKNRYLTESYRKEATVHIWTQEPFDTSSIVALSLAENLIRYRLDRLEDGTRKYFVRPEDEVQAREILREINMGEPPR